MFAILSLWARPRLRVRRDHISRVSEAQDPRPAASQGRWGGLEWLVELTSLLNSAREPQRIPETQRRGKSTRLQRRRVRPADSHVPPPTRCAGHREEGPRPKDNVSKPMGREETQASEQRGRALREAESIVYGRLSLRHGSSVIPGCLRGPGGGQRIVLTGPREACLEPLTCRRFHLSTSRQNPSQVWT